MNKKARFIIVVICLTAGSLMGLAFGSVRLSFSQLWNGLQGTDRTAGVILLSLRLPRVLGAALSGAALASAGVLLQGATGNDLAAPNVIGVNAGAGLAVMIVLCFLPVHSTLLAVFSFAGALLASFTVLGISQVSPAHSGRTALVLAGVAVGSLLNAGIAFLSQCYPDAVTSYVYFSTGGFSGVRMNDLYVPAFLIVGGIIAAELLGNRLNILQLGDDLAQSLGVSVKRVRILAMVLASLLCASSVMYAGLLGFVGLIVPHISRRLIGHDFRLLLPFAALSGSVLVVLADLIGRTVFAPAEISAGILLAMIGAPFFLYLLLRRKRYD